MTKIFEEHLKHFDKKNDKHKKTSKHHIVPSSRGGVDDKDNIIKLHRNTHDALHQLFANLTPVEQILFVIHMNQKVFNKNIINVLALLSEEENSFYKHGIKCKNTKS